jgi:hypothetical protein
MSVLMSSVDRAVVPSEKGVVDHQIEQERGSTFVKYIQAHAPSIGRDEGLALAKFISLQHKGDEVCNIYKHCDIIASTKQNPDLLTEETVQKLCKLQRSMMNDEAKDKNDVKVMHDSKIVIEAINTLVACQQHGDAVGLFGKICTPTAEEDKALRQKYAKLEFAREVVVDSILGPEARKFLRSGSVNDIDEEEEDVDTLLQQAAASLLILVFGGCFIYWNNFA